MWICMGEVIWHPMRMPAYGSVANIAITESLMVVCSSHTHKHSICTGQNVWDCAHERKWKLSSWESEHKRAEALKSADYIGIPVTRRERHQTQDLFLRRTKSKSTDAVKSTRHVTLLSNQVPKTIYFINAPQILFREQRNHVSDFSWSPVPRGPRWHI